MRTIRLFIVSIFVLLAAASAAFAQAPHIVFTWPADAEGQLKPMLIYNRDSNTEPADVLIPIDHVTPVPAQAGVPTPVPAPLTFVKPGYKSVFDVYVSQDDAITEETKWDMCSIGISTTGGIDTTTTTCGGAVKTPNSTSSVSVFSVGVGFADNPNTKTGIKPPFGYMLWQWNLAPQRTVTFRNATGLPFICLNFETQFNTESCTGPGDVLVSNLYVHKVPEAGNMSSAAFVTGFATDLLRADPWFYTGRQTDGGVYATVMEWTMFPTAVYDNTTGVDFLPGTTNHSVGMSNVDVSAVNGFNFGVHLSLESEAICSTAGRTASGDVLPAKFDVYSGALAELPATGHSLAAACPSHSAVGGNTLGCLSPCEYAQQQGRSDVDKVCCSGDYAVSQTCTASEINNWPNEAVDTGTVTHADLPYVKNLAAPVTRNVYRWQFDDYVGDFSCEPGASFVFDIVAP